MLYFHLNINQSINSFKHINNMYVKITKLF